MRQQSFRGIARWWVILAALFVLVSIVAGCSIVEKSPTAPGIEQTVVKPGAQPSGPPIPLGYSVEITMKSQTPWPVEVGLPASGRHFTLNPGTSVTVRELGSSTVTVTYLNYRVTQTLPKAFVSPLFFRASGTVVRTAPGIFVIQTP